jgi:hypothetical protein
MSSGRGAAKALWLLSPVVLHLQRANHPVPPPNRHRADRRPGRAPLHDRGPLPRRPAARQR